ncbi:hypothetical protein K4K61_002826 [Colletotrichum sp. SAR11_59]|nr:hypothetical protein K4K61_002826 [Colletotrichum sp. SAR11_59]
MSSNDKMLSEEEEHMSRTELVFRYSPYVPLAKRKNEFGVLLPTDSTHSDSNKGMKKSTSKSDKQAEDFQVIVEVVKLICGGSEEGCQVLLCKATKVPQREIWTTSPKNIDEPSLYGEPLTVGDLVVVKVFDPLFKNQTRRVGAVVMEYIQGRSIEDLCPRNQHYRLVPPKGLTFVDFEKKKRLDFNKQLRLKVLKKFMKYSVHQLHAGVEHWWPQPENVLITTDDRGKPRVVLIDYVSSMIDSKRKEPYGLFKDYPKPPHPWTQFSLVKLTNFAGWYPAGWSNEQFATWVYLRFGSLENSNCTDPMTKKAGTQNESESDSEEEDAKGSTSVTRPSTPFEGLGRMMGSIRIKRSTQ